MSEHLLLALDFGGTKLSAAVLAQGESDWRDQRRVFSPHDADGKYDVETMLNMAEALLGDETPAAIGVSFGGPVDFERGVVRLSHHVPGWENVPLRKILEDRFGAAAAVDNDANVGALGEQRYGAGRGTQHMLYVTVSTGVGGGWILNGQPWRGWQGMAGEIGHTMVDPDGPPCLCGNRGCVERLASGPYMAQDAAQRLSAAEAEGEERGAILRQMAEGDVQAITGKMLSEAAEAGDELAREILQRGAAALGAGIGNAANLVNPEKVVLGGGVTKAGDLWWNTLRQTVDHVTMPEVDVELVAAELGDDAPLWGAVALAVEIGTAEHGVTRR